MNTAPDFITDEDALALNAKEMAEQAPPRTSSYFHTVAHRLQQHGQELQRQLDADEAPLEPHARKAFKNHLNDIGSAVHALFITAYTLDGDDENLGRIMPLAEFLHENADE